MVRQARQQCESGIYHIMMRGINRQDIFYDVDDYQHFLETLKRIKINNDFELYGYCLMSNHVHLLIHKQSEEISKVMQRIGTSYAWWYNQKYQRTGHLFQGRYGSECVEDDAYLLTVIRYIHKNPVTARMVSEPEDYRWSSIHAYYSGSEYLSGLTDTSFILGFFAQEQTEAVRKFREHMKIDIQDTCLDEKVVQKKTDNQLKVEIEAMLDGSPLTILQNIEKQKRDEILRQVKLIDGTTHRQIARVIGLNQNIVFKA